MALRLALHFLDGRVIKGSTANFNPKADGFAFSQADLPANTPPKDVWLKDLKAVFFVKTFSGNSTHQDRKEFRVGDTFQGRRLKITFLDGEVMVGSSPNYGAGCAGFFFFPADPETNTIKAWIPGSSVRSVSIVT